MPFRRWLQATVERAISGGLFNIVPYGPLPNALLAVAFGNGTQL